MNDLAKARVTNRIQEKLGVDLGYCQHCEEAIREIEQWGDIARDALEEREAALVERDKYRSCLRGVRAYSGLPEVLKRVIDRVLPQEWESFDGNHD